MHQNDGTPPKVKYIGSTEACALLEIDRATLTRWIQTGLIKPAGKLPGVNGAYLWDPQYITGLVIDRGLARNSGQAAS